MSVQPGVMADATQSYGREPPESSSPASGLPDSHIFRRWLRIACPPHVLAKAGVAPAPACPRPRAQPRLSRRPRIAVRGRPRRSGPLSTGCGGIGSQGSAPDFAGATNRLQSTAWRVRQARRIHANTRCVHAVAEAGEGVTLEGVVPGSRTFDYAVAQADTKDYERSSLSMCG